MSFRRFIIAAGCLLTTMSPASALTISGTAEVIDSDLLLLEGYRVYLLGVESIESGQTCQIDGDAWECYPAAVRALQTIVGEGEITCDVVSGPNFLDEVIALCSINGEDVGRRLVRSGFGLTIPDETDAYEGEMETARDERRGLWQGAFITPDLWRQANRIYADRPTFRPVDSPG